MRIFFYINVLSGGGAERVVANLASQLSEQGYDTAIITSFSTKREYSTHEKVKRFNLESRENKQQNRIKKNVSRIRLLRQIVRHERPDVLISFMAEPNFRAILATLGLDTKAIVSVRNDPNREYAGLLGKIVGKVILPLADGCVFQTKDAMKWFPQSLQNKSIIIYNAVNDIFYRVFRQPEKGRIVTFGRLNKQKNQKLLIDAFSKIADRYQEAKLYIYGEGDMHKELESYIQNMELGKRVFLMGNVENVAEVMSRADLFVLSSDYEGMPNALMESMAVGLPVISTDCPCGGPRMLIENLKNGILIPPGDKDALVIAMEKLLSNRNYLTTLGDAAKNEALSFRADRILKEWTDYITKVLSDE